MAECIPVAKAIKNNEISKALEELNLFFKKESLPIDSIIKMKNNPNNPCSHNKRDISVCDKDLCSLKYFDAPAPVPNRG